MSRLRRISAVLAAIATVAGCFVFASAGAQTDLPATAPLGVWCPEQAGRVVGQVVTCKVVADPDWTAPTTQPTTPTTTTVPTTTTTTVPPVTTTTTAVTTTTTTVAPTTTTSTPPPNPPATLMGWQLTSTNTGLAPQGLTCMGLPLYSGPAKLTAGQTYTGLRFESALDLSAGNVVVEKSCIKPRNTGVLFSLASTTFCHSYCETNLPAGTRATVRDSEFDGSYISNANVAGSCAFDGIADLYRNYMHDVGSGICFRATDRDAKAGSWAANRSTSAVISGNYVTRLRHSGEAHHDGGTVRDFRKDTSNSRSLVFINNRFDSQPINVTDWQTAAFVVQPTYSGYSINNVWLDGNLFEGRSYNLTLEQAGGGYSNVHSTNNRFWQPTNCGGGCYGHSSVVGGPGWSEWLNNYKLDTSAVNAQGAPVNP